MPGLDGNDLDGNGLDKYRAVIKMVISKYAKDAANSPEFITAQIINSLEIALELANLAQPVSVSMETTEKPVPEKPALIRTGVMKEAPSSSGVFLISSAPPVAGLEDEDLNAPDADIDYWESKPGKGDGCQRLQSKLQALLPRSITVQVPGSTEPLTLVCGIGSPGVRFVHVNYTLPGDSLGPRYTLMTSQKDLDKDVIVQDICAQAAALYSKEKRKLTPQALPAVAPPSNRDLQAMLDRDRKAQQPNDGLSGEDAQRASDDAKAWAQSRSPQWR